MPGPDQLSVAMVVEQLYQPVPGGSGTYVVALGDALRRREDLRVVGIAAAHRGAPAADWRTQVPVRHAPLPRRLLYAAWQHAHVPRAEHVARTALDVCHATTWAVPPTRAPLVVTVHDLAFLEGPELFTPHGNAFFRRALDDVRRRADAVVVPSRATADDCVRAGIDPDLLHVVPHGVDVPRPSPTAVAAAQARLDVGSDYVMWAGTVEPRKNVDRLLEAYAAAVAADPGVPDLVLTGPAGWGAEPVVPPSVRTRVRRTGRVSRDDLHALLAGATAFVFPSLSEGFGFPVLEAMAHGTPVVTSRATACAEVLGDTGVLVDPLDVDDIARGILTALGPDGARMRVAGRARAATYTWDTAAERTVDAYRAAVRRRA
ncbi:glycosyltransferase family 4 protein [Cellulomonas avistercoris]|nr:glycosyltransferase family 1 protein [Cellulomonas avistercoris]